MLITDDHIHLQDDPGGTARAFKAAGGTHMFVVNLPYRDVPSWEKGWAPQYERTVALARRAAEEGVTTFPVIGPYPADLVRVYEAKGVVAAREHLMEGVRVAMRLIADGKAVALGEMGRPHFPAPAEAVAACDEVLAFALESARDAGCAVVLHTEDGAAAFRDMARLADAAGFPKDRLVKHYSAPAVLPDENFGLFPSVLAKRGNAEAALAKGSDRFMLETDYLDDARRPGAVLAPSTVPRRTKALIAGGVLSERAAYRLHVENPARVYGVDIL